MNDQDKSAIQFGGRALLIEDNAIVAMNVEDMLRALGFDHVDCAASVEEALRFARTHTYASAIVDVKVKDGDSLPAALVLAANGVPLVIASGYGNAALPAGLENVPCLAKPYGDEELAAALGEARRRMKPALYRREFARDLPPPRRNLP